MPRDTKDVLWFDRQIQEVKGDVQVGAYPTGKDIQVGHFFVPEESRGEGRAREVMSAIIEAAKGYGAERLVATIGYTRDEHPDGRDNDPTTRFLDSMGFDYEHSDHVVRGVRELDYD